MHAITVDHFREVPALRDIAAPTAGEGQVLIQIHAAGVNPMDRAIADGQFEAVMPAAFPLVLGSDVAGEVVALGDGADGFALGDRVFGQLLIAPLGSTGTYAEYVAVPQTAPLAVLPEGMSYTTAAALPTAGVTALQLARTLEPVVPKTVVIVGAGGAVGSFLTQLLFIRLGTVTAVARGSERARLLGYGANSTIDHTTTPVAAALRATYPAGVDALVDLASGAEQFASLAELLRPRGIAVSTRYAADVDALARREITGVNFQVNVAAIDLAAIALEVVAGRLDMPPVRTTELASAVALLSSHPDKPFEGKTVITLP